MVKNSWRTRARTTTPVTRISTSVSSNGAGSSASPRAVRHSSVPSVTFPGGTPPSRPRASAAVAVRAAARIAISRSTVIQSAMTGYPCSSCRSGRSPLDAMSPLLPRGIMKLPLT